MYTQTSATHTYKELSLCEQPARVPSLRFRIIVGGFALMFLLESIASRTATCLKAPGCFFNIPVLTLFFVIAIGEISLRYHREIISFPFISSNTLTLSNY